MSYRSCKVDTKEIILGKRPITTGTPLRLVRYSSTSPQFWMGLQSDYDLDVADDTLGDRMEVNVRPMVTIGQFLCSGLSHRNGRCGAASGAIMGIHLVAGRNSPVESSARAAAFQYFR
jgi:hypothetical protein